MFLSGQCCHQTHRIHPLNKVSNKLVKICLLMLLMMAGSHSSWAGPKEFDPVTGVDPVNYPPDQPVDFKHLKLELLFDDLMSKSFSGTAFLTIRPIHENVTSLVLDAVDFQINSVSISGRKDLRYDYDDKKIYIHLTTPITTDADSIIRIDYRCIDPQYGMIWALPDKAYPDRPLVIHTQGEPEFARMWFPCLDFPVDRCTSEVIATIPSNYKAISNGRLVQQSTDSRSRRTTFHYLQEQPHAFYLVSLVIGQFNEVKDKWRDVDVQYFVPPGKGEVARLTYGRTPEMLDHFSDLLGYDYPFAKYSQTNVPLFMFGGMENSSATTMADTALLTPRASIDQDMEGLISHELAHQWFGDLITCRGWKHIWLNEGFATFMASVWKEKSKGREEYLYEFWKRYEGVAANDNTDSGPGILFDDYRYPFETFRIKGAMPYMKGSCILNMLRHELGEELFWRSIRAYIRAYAYHQAETNDLRRVFETVTGRNLEQFFTQWILRYGVVHLDVNYRWDSAKNEAVVTVKQTQTIDRDTPAFNVPLDLYFYAGGEDVVTTIQLKQRKEVYRRHFNQKPEQFCVDPYAGLLKKLNSEKPKQMWIDQLFRGPTNVSRCSAAKHLARHHRPEVVAALKKAAEDTNEHWSVRVEAVNALGAMRTNTARDTLAALLRNDRVLENHDFRVGLMTAAGKYDSREIGASLAPFAVADPSERVEAAATRALGKVSALDVQDILVQNAHKESYGYQIRIAAIGALVQRDDPQAMDVAMHYAQYGQHDRIRPVAIRALGKIARMHKQSRAKIRPSLIRWLTDPQDRALLASIGSLGDIGDAESVAALNTYLDSHPRPVFYYAVKDTLAKIDPETESESVKSLRQSVEKMRKSLSELRDKFDGVHGTAEEVEK